METTTQEGSMLTNLIEAPDRRYYLVAGRETLGILANAGREALRWALEAPGRTGLVQARRRPEVPGLPKGDDMRFAFDKITLAGTTKERLLALGCSEEYAEAERENILANVVQVTSSIEASNLLTGKV